MAGFMFRGAVHYSDGSTVEFECGNAAVAAYERYAARHKLPMGKDAPPTLSSLVIAHHALAIAEGFDAWVETVDGIELNAAEGSELPPTLEAPSTEGP